MLIRADAAASLGAGHVVRCLALAEALQGAAWQVHFAFRPGSLETVPALKTSLFHLHEISCGPADEPRFLGEIREEGFDLLVIDHYARGLDFERSCRCFARRIMVIEDLPNRPHDCDLLLDQNSGQDRGRYKDHVSRECSLLLGPAYALLRPQFAEARARTLARRKDDGPLRRILVSIGSSDNRRMVPLVLKGIAETLAEAKVDVAIGPSSPGLADIRAWEARSAGRVKVHVGTNRMAELMTEADLAFGAAGSSCWECCCLGLPSLVILTADNQMRVARELQRHGAAEILGTWEAINGGLIAGALRRHAGDGQRRRRMSRRAALLCDGRGTLRALLELTPPEVAADGKPVKLRLATEEDGDMMFAWQSDPNTRRSFRNPAPPKKEEHRNWLSRALEDPRCFLAMVLHGDRAAGVLRLDGKEDEVSREISIYTAPGSYRLGLAAGALKVIRRVMPRARLCAEVLPGNAASHALFRSAGYRPAGGCYISDPEIPDRRRRASSGSGAEAAPLEGVSVSH